MCRPPSWASWSKHARTQGPHQPHSPGRSQPAGGYDQRGEREPLLGGRSDTGIESLSRNPSTIPRIVVYIFLGLFAFFAIFFMSVGYSLNSFINTRYYEAIRQGWAHEVEKHQALRLEMNHDEAMWEEKRSEHQEQERQRQDDENKKWETIRQGWALEVAEHQEQERQRQDNENKRWEAVRQGWATEVAKYQALQLKMNQDEAVWEERRAKHEEEERKRHEDEVKKREGISWEGLTAARCSRYATREYTALLSHIPLGVDAMDECRKKSINIHGRDLLPSRCEDQVGNYFQGIPEFTNHPTFVGSLRASYGTLGCGL